MSEQLAFDVEDAVRDRYGAGSQRCENELCCAIAYDPRFLDVLPAEIRDRDYGCGDPSAHVGAGEIVLDLGSGSGKICYILSQKVGPGGSVVGVDMNDDMLALARRYQGELAERIGHNNVSFRKGRIQDLALGLEAAEAWLAGRPVTDLETWSSFEAECDRLRREEPLVAADSVDVVVSNCVLNLVKPAEKGKLFDEMFRVLARVGRAVISDIVCDEDPTEKIMSDPKLWSGCVSGAFREDHFLRMFESAGFHGIEILDRGDQPWRTIDGIEFRPITVRAHKGKSGPCLERNQAVIYKGPWKQVHDDDGHHYLRGERMAVCDKTYRILMDPGGPYSGQFIGVAPFDAVPLDAAGPFDCGSGAKRHPRQTKGQDYRASVEADPSEPCCGPESGIC